MVRVKNIRIEDIAHIIGPNASIGIGNACAEPQTLIEGLIQAQDSFTVVDLYGMIHYSTD